MTLGRLSVKWGGGITGGLPDQKLNWENPDEDL